MKMVRMVGSREQVNAALPSPVHQGLSSGPDVPCQLYEPKHSARRTNRRATFRAVLASVANTVAFPAQAWQTMPCRFAVAFPVGLWPLS